MKPANIANLPITYVKNDSIIVGNSVAPGNGAAGRVVEIAISPTGRV